MSSLPHDANTATPLTPLRHRDERRAHRQAGTRRAMRAVKAEHAAQRTLSEVLAERLTSVASSPAFLVLHLVWFTAWLLWNTGVLDVPPFDPYPFGLLTTVVSLEAIVLAIFVLMAQNRESAIAEIREEVTLAVNLRMEEEVTKTLQLVAGLYARMGHPLAEDDDLRDMLRPLDAEAMERALLDQIAASAPGRRKELNGSGTAPERVPSGS